MRVTDDSFHDCKTGNTEATPTGPTEGFSGRLSTLGKYLSQATQTSFCMQFF
jgi:hypothetical protein